MAKNEFYFAYGSNLHVGQMLQRCPSARFIGKAVLNNHRLEIRKHMDIDQVEGEQVEGVLYALSKEDIKVLDRYEGVPFSYNKLRVKVKCDNLLIPGVFTYMKNKANIEYVMPTTIYYNKVLSGLRFWGLSQDDAKQAYKRIKAIVAKQPKKVVTHGFRTPEGSFTSWEAYCQYREENFDNLYAQRKAQRWGAKNYKELHANTENSIQEAFDFN